MPDPESPAAGPRLAGVPALDTETAYESTLPVAGPAWYGWNADAASAPASATAGMAAPASLTLLRAAVGGAQWRPVLLNFFVLRWAPRGLKTCLTTFLAQLLQRCASPLAGPDYSRKRGRVSFSIRLKKH